MLKEKASQLWSQHFSLAGTLFNFCTVLSGSGWVTTALTNSQMGLLLGSLSMVGLGAVNAFTCSVMLQAAEQFGTPDSYHNLTQSVLGSRWASLLDLAIAVSEFFACCQRLILLGDFGVAVKHRLITQGYMPSRALIVLLLTVVLGFPLIWTRRITALEKVSSVALACTLTALGVLIYTFVSTELEPGLPLTDVVLANWSPNLLLALPIQQFAFAGQAGIIPVYREMPQRSLARGKLLVYLSFSICTLLYLAFGILAYLQFPGALRANLFINYAEKPGTLYDVTFCLLIVASIGAFPLNVFIGRVHLGYLLLGQKRSSQRKWEIILASFYAVGSVGVCLVCKNLAVAQGLGGGIGENFVNFVVPAFALLKLVREGSRDSDGGGGKRRTDSDSRMGQRTESDSEKQRLDLDRLTDQRTDSDGGKRQTDSDSWAKHASPAYEEGDWEKRAGLEVGRGDPNTRAPASSSDGATGTSQTAGIENRIVGLHSEGFAVKHLAESKSHAGKEREISAGHDHDETGSGKKYTLVEARINQVVAYALLALAALLAVISTVGNLVSLCLVGWGDSGSTFF